MIPCTLPKEPEGFDERCRQAGAGWLAENPGKDPRDFWSPFRPDLRRGFRGLCAYMAMFIPEPGTVDHFISQKEDPLKAYEWGNFRFASSTMNNWKRTARSGTILDPLEVQEGWFEVILPSLQLVVADSVPIERRALAEETIRRLKLRDDERVIEVRQEWLKLYEEGHLTLEGLERRAPLVAAAVRKRAGLG